jgi:signal transduction histidine kinase
MEILVVVEVLVVILGIALIAVLLWILLIKRDMRKLSKNLKSIAENADKAIHLDEPLDSGAAGLADSMSSILESRQHGERENSQVKNKLRDAMLKTANNQKIQLAAIQAELNTFFTQDVDKETERMSLENIEAKLSYLHEHADKLIEYTNVIEGKVPIHIRQNNVSNILRDTLAEYNPDLRERGIIVQSELPAAPITCLCDENILVTVLRYLFRNVCLYGKELMVTNLAGGTIEIANKTDDLQDVDVSDLFNVFVNSEVFESSMNRGLGLAIVKGLVELTKGRLRAEMVGDMLSIRITLPMIATYTSNPEKVEDFRVKT